MLFILVISNTNVAEIPGITVAGENPELVKYTPPADAEYLFYERPICIDAIPVTPAGHPTPAIITKAVKELINMPILVVRSGSIIAPNLPYIHITERPGENIVNFTAIQDMDKILNNAKILAKQISKIETEVMLAESVPGGTTTAQAVLTALGYNAQVSSADIENPIDLKKEIVKKAMSRVQLPVNWKTALKEFGDPMMAFINGFVPEFEGTAYLAGGTQMLAVAALLKEQRIQVKKIATTRYITDDKTSSFKKTAFEIGVNYYSAPLNFSGSKYKGLRDYESGMVKEGVGAGGAVYLAEKNGIRVDKITEKVEMLYSKFIK